MKQCQFVVGNCFMGEALIECTIENLEINMNHVDNLPVTKEANSTIESAKYLRSSIRCRVIQSEIRRKSA